MSNKTEIKIMLEKASEYLINEERVVINIEKEGSGKIIMKVEPRHLFVTK